MSKAALWIARSGAPWRDLPERFGPWKRSDYLWTVKEGQIQFVFQKHDRCESGKRFSWPMYSYQSRQQRSRRYPLF
ncbi:transposase [Spirosoma agri]|uniref:Transposase n=1 Tax=Spirosoma agri TaxID=1987381 RepID=A0A6M0IMK2_9BACT|nr:transposase [Spirosoma agri]